MSSSDNESPYASPPASPFMDLANRALHELMDDSVEKMYADMLEAHVAESSQRTTRKRRTTLRNHEVGDARIWKDYFSPQPVYPENYFRRRFRMSKKLFNRILEGISQHSPYFTQRYDCSGRKGLSPHQKCTCSIRQLAYGTAGDLHDDYIRIGGPTAVECLQKFCRCVIEVFLVQYLRRPNSSDIERLLEAYSTKHGFPGMLGSIDCMHWAWKNCPVAWKGQYTRGDHGYTTIMLEAVASYDLWIWHAYFGVGSSNNDINVLNQSSVFNQVLQGNTLPCNFTVNGTSYTKGYYLVDDIYIQNGLHLSHPGRV
ncbi:uncharacterized protein LOC110942928 [Helianthus annuus]|uniref:uncharacterized protein LOC110942928 n=1 Tax=Helianthus annuus TaxID=4232 RepID=UPI000B8F128C|nr:uncharacterized protein LOC110942928 [Helianthus annuus]